MRVLQQSRDRVDRRLCGDAGLVQPEADRVIVFGGSALDNTGAASRLPDMFELSISQRWWRQAWPHGGFRV